MEEHRSTLDILNMSKRQEMNRNAPPSSMPIYSFDGELMGAEARPRWLQECTISVAGAKTE
eukprot:9898336-Karenia_brevis.AAC.1